MSAETTAHAGSASRLTRRVLVLCSGTTLAHLLMLAVSPLLTRLFTPASFAVFGFHQATLTVLAVVLTLQYEVAIPIPKSEHRASVLLQLALRIGAVATLLMTALALVWSLLPVPEQWWIPVAVLAMIPLCAFGEAAGRCYRLDCVRQAQFNRMTLARMIQAVVTVASHVITGCLGWVMLGLPLGDGLGRWASAGYFMWLSRSAHRRNGLDAATAITWDDYRSALREYVRFPAFVVPGVVIASLINVLPALVLPGLYGKEFAGQFALANKSVLLPLMIISQAVTQVYVSDASRFVREQDPAMRRLIGTTARQMGALGLLLAGCAAVMGPLLFPLVFGAKWAVAGQIVPYLALSAFAQFVGGPVNQILVLLGRETRKLMLHIAGLIAVTVALFAGHGLGLTALQTTAAYAVTILGIQTLYLWQSIAMVEQQARAWEADRLPASESAANPPVNVGRAA